MLTITIFAPVMTNEKDNKDATITFRTATQRKASLEKLAKKERRSVGNLIEVLIDEALEGRKKK